MCIVLSTLSYWTSNDISNVSQHWNVPYACLDIQEEQYEHLDELEMLKVDKQVNDAMIWMNSKMNAQSKHNLTQEPAVKVREIQAKTKVSANNRFA